MIKKMSSKQTRTGRLGRAFHLGCLFSLSPEPQPSPTRSRLGRRRRCAYGALFVTNRKPTYRPRWQNVLSALTPGKYIPLILGLFAEDEPNKNIETADREEEKSGDEWEFADVV